MFFGRKSNFFNRGGGKRVGEILPLICFFGLLFLPFVFSSCDPINNGTSFGGGASGRGTSSGGTSPGGSSSVSITLEKLGSASSIRAIPSGDVGRLKNATVKYRIIFRNAGGTKTRETTGGTVSETFEVGTEVRVTVECLNAKNQVIVRSVEKSITVGSGTSSLAFKLSEDGNEIVPDDSQPGGDAPGGDTPAPNPPAPAEPVTIEFRPGFVYDANSQVPWGEMSSDVAQGGGFTWGQPVEKAKGAVVDRPTVPNYTFLGWIEGVQPPTGGLPSAYVTTYTGNMTLSAIWERQAAPPVLDTLYVGGNGASDATGDGSQGSPFATLQKAFEVAATNAQIPITIEVQSDLSNTAATMTGGTITLNLNEKTITGTGNASVITITGGELTLNGPNADGKITGGGGTEGGGVKVGDYNGNVASFTMNSGTISNNNTTDPADIGFGGGVHVGPGSTFTLDGGNINNNTTDGDGGGVYSDGEFILKSGSISMNTSTGSGRYGGGVAINTNGRFTMNAGSIIVDNTAAAGSAIFAGGPSVMEGGQIQGNTTTGNNDAAVRVESSFTMRGGEIIGNSSYGIYVYKRNADANPVFIKGGGSVSCTAGSPGSLKVDEGGMYNIDGTNRVAPAGGYTKSDAF